METRQTSFTVALLNYLHLYYNISLNLGGYFTYHNVLTIKFIHFVPIIRLVWISEQCLSSYTTLSGFYNSDGGFTARYGLSL